MINDSSYDSGMHLYTVDPLLSKFIKIEEVLSITEITQENNLIFQMPWLKVTRKQVM